MDTIRIGALRQYIHQNYPYFPVPGTSYLIMMSPRCGSNLLCTHLEKIGFGKPIEAFHFNHRRMKERYHWDIDFDDPAAYMKTAINYQMVEGVLGMKTNWSQFETFLETAHKLSDPFDPTIRDDELTEALLPNAAYILMKRRQKVKQAISYSKAMQTGIWMEKKNQDESYKEYVLPPIYDREHIESCLDELLAFDVCWENYLARHNLNYLEVWYEDLVKDFERKMLEIYAFLGIKKDSPLPPLLKRQADAASEEWYRRFSDSTDWLHEPSIKDALDRGDSLTAFLNRFMMLSRRKERLRWEKMPSARFKPMRKLYFRVRRRITDIMTPNEDAAGE
jgi:LPS sulfotransferase NodH